MLKLFIFIIGLVSGVSIHYIIAPSAGPESIEDAPVSSIQHADAKNEKQLLREIAALKQLADTTVGCPSSTENNNSYSNASPNSSAWEEDSEQPNSEPETQEDQFEQGQVLEY